METLSTLWKKPAIKGIFSCTNCLYFAITIKSTNEISTDSEEISLKSVEVTTAAEEVAENKDPLIGTVRAFTEADITTEKAGRITSVGTTLEAVTAESSNCHDREC